MGGNPLDFKNSKQDDILVVLVANLCYSIK